MAYKPGSEVEVTGEDGIFKFAYYGARVRAIHEEGLEVVYHNRKTMSGEFLVEIVKENQVRSLPDVVVGEFNQKDFVEVLLWGGWWRGQVLGKDNASCDVFFAYRQEGDQYHIVPKGLIRIHQRWRDDGDSVMWLFKKRLPNMVFKVGDEVEVVGVNGIYKYALFGARVLDMQGETVKVEYHTQLNPAGGRLSERVNVSQVRYIPDLVAGEIVLHDFVEAWVDGAWWGDVVLGGNEEAAILYFGYKATAAHCIKTYPSDVIHTKSPTPTYSNLNLLSPFSKKNSCMANGTMMVIGMNQAIREQRGIFEVEDEVEVTGREGEIGAPFHPGVITKLQTGKVTVKYYGLKKQDGKTLIETVEIENVRPKPIDFRFKFKWGDYVDVWVMQRWCPGRYISDVGRKKASCILFTTEEDEICVFKKEDVRVSLTWKYENRESIWTFKRMLRDLL